MLFRSLMSQEGGPLRKKFSHVAVQIDPEEGQMSEPEGARRYLDTLLPGRPDHASTGEAPRPSSRELQGATGKRSLPQ